MTMPNPWLTLGQSGAGQEALGAMPGEFGPNRVVDANGNGTAYYTDANGRVTRSVPIVGGVVQNTGGSTGGASTGVNAAPGTPPMTAAQQDALAKLTVILNQYGLGSLADWVRQKLVDGASDSTILLELYDQPAFKARFPAIAARREQGMNAMTPAEILAYETQAQQLFHMAGLPASFGDPANVQKLIGENVSIAELSARIENGYLKVANAPKAVTDAFRKYFGVNGHNAMVALFLDPQNSLPELEKMAMTAYVGGIGSTFGVNLAMQRAKQVADTGLSEAAIWAGFRQLDTLSPLFAETLAEATDFTKEQEGVGAVFGTEPGQEAKLDQRRRTRVNAMGGSGQGGALSTERGVIGLGVADS